MKKKIFAFGLLIVLLSTQTGATASVSPFPDVPTDSAYAGSISYMQSRGIIKGYDNGEFRPDGTINRAEALKLLFLVRQELSLPSAGFSQPVSFPDVNTADWFYDYVEDAYNLGIVKGYDDGTFKPANQITAAESLKIIYTGLYPDLKLPDVTEKPFTDVTLDRWYAPYLQFGKDKSFVQAKGDGSYDPGRAMTRAEFVEAIYRVMYSRLNNLDQFPLSQNWVYCNNYELGYKIKKPFFWEIIPAGDQMIFWKQDKGNGQVSFARLFPNSSVAIVAVDKNSSRLSLDSYLSQIEYGEGAKLQTMTLNGLPYASVHIDANGLYDSYFQLPNGTILILYTQTGDGVLSEQLLEEIRYIIGSVRGSDSQNEGISCLGAGGSISTPVQTSPSDEKRANVLSYVLQDGAAISALDVVDDELLFETDSIGIGTGPVDYYYSVFLDMTLKVDRNSATLLSTNNGKITSF